jgi:hypothetical protein
MAAAAANVLQQQSDGNWLLLSVVLQCMFEEVRSRAFAWHLVRAELIRGRLRYRYLDRNGGLHEGDLPEGLRDAKFKLSEDSATLPVTRSVARLLAGDRQPYRQNPWISNVRKAMQQQHVLPSPTGERPWVAIYRIQVLDQDVVAIWPALVSSVQALLGISTKSAVTPSTSNAERECARYLAGLMKASPKLQPKRKADYRNECQTLFQGLTGRAFNRAWQKEIKCAPGWSA